ncbi:hypothetical protein GCM10017674_15110 [Streptomyces gardneri]|uniref:Hemerythrin-like domain-containing protein n=1 Tax=Streptomyces gardneri TaxID=66892 RepID=A0A4Y3RB04_9ACTN|nr:hypothetical protein SGA01_02040 [Streptomyces gardneri]GHG88773.1 hypothetical protein GCM10017674_15110 [Streptomyces gardneri]
MGPREHSTCGCPLDRLATRLEEHFAYEESRLLPALDPDA